MPMHHTVNQHRTLALHHILEVLDRHGLDPVRHRADVGSMLAHPAVGKLFQLLEASGRGEDVTAEGDERLRLWLAIVLALTEHAADAATRAGGKPSPAVARAVEGLLMALGEPAEG
jgi:hypothetical protein